MAVVVADSRYVAEDAVDEIEVDYEALPAVTDVASGQAADAPVATVLREDYTDLGLYAITVGDRFYFVEYQGVRALDLRSFPQLGVALEQEFEEQTYALGFTPDLMIVGTRPGVEIFSILDVD